MKVAVDVDYRDADATVAAVAFNNWEDPSPLYVESATVSPIAPYEPGAFYKRELPCILKILTILSCKYPNDKIEMIVVDGYVWLGENHPGLGYKLYEALNQTIPVIGVAKTHFKGADTAIPVTRGQSKSPLFVTAAGLGNVDAGILIHKMHGEFRFPTLLKMVDSACRGKPL